MPHLQVWVVESLLATDALSRIEAKHLGQEVNSKRIPMGVKRREWDSRFDGQGSDVVLGLCRRFGMNNQRVIRDTYTRRADATEGIF